jgi:hypothetical protein
MFGDYFILFLFLFVFLIQFGDYLPVWVRERIINERKCPLEK